MTECVLAIDQGTTSTTAVLVDVQGRIVAQVCVEFPQRYPQAGWVECDAQELWKTTQRAVQGILHKTPQATKISALGITNQRETAVIWEKESGKPIYAAISWQCRRTAEMCANLKQRGVEKLVRKKTGLVIDPYFSATKIAWVLDKVDGARERAERGKLAFGTIDTWLLWKLTAGQVHKTDYTNASRTLLFNIEEQAWDAELLEIFCVPPAILPEVCASAGVCGTVVGGELEGVPIAGIAGDQQAAAFGQLCLDAGTVKNTYGTGCFLVLNTGTSLIHSSAGLLSTIACGRAPHEPVYALEGSVFVAGAAVQWLRDGLQIIDDAKETEQIANSVSDTCGVTVVPAFTGLGAPHWDAQARGAIIGITRGTERAHIVRATLEAIALQSAEIVKLMSADAGVPITRLRVDGGASANDFLMQFQADITDVEVERPCYIETTALGAAYLAGLAVEIWQDIEEIEAQHDVDRIFFPQMDAEQRAQRLSAWQTAVRRIQTK